ncbi:MAG: AraC family transcriptional regulator [Tenuifilaceae bacterium]|jgi:AraC-like DNA-binding protein|nr:AraC family transcriptional regulator [Tenuifilaceae bacterium]
MIALLIIGIFQSALLVFLLLAKKNKGIADFILSGYLFISAITLLFAYLEIWSRNQGYSHPWLINLSTPLILLIGPSLWLYVKSLTTQTFRFKPIYIILSVPFVVVLALLISANYIAPSDIKVELDQTEAFRGDIVFYIVMGIIALSNVGYTLWGLLLIRQYRNRIKSFFSQTENIDLKWLRFLLVSAFISYASISVLYIVDTALELLSYQNLQLMGFGIASLFVLAVGFVGLKQGNIFTSMPEHFDLDRELVFSDKLSPISDHDEAFVHTLLGHMKEKKPHQNPELTISKLSHDLGCTPEYLSGIINGRLNMNFFDFVNHHRIEEFKLLASNPNNQKLTLISLAYDSGFNSKATFNRVFKKEVGCTPSEYLSRFSL